MKCLVTTLRDAADNANLPVYGAIKITLNGGGNYSFYIDGCKGVIDGNGYFTDDTYTEVGDAEKVMDGTIYIRSNGVCTLTVYKYLNDAVNNFKVLAVSGTITNPFNKVMLNLEEVFQNKNKMDEIKLGYTTTWPNVNTGTTVSGNIENIVPNAMSVYLNGCKGISGNVSNIVRDYATSTNLTLFNLYGTPLVLNAASLDGKYHLNLEFPNGMYGDFKYLADLNQTRYFLSIPTSNGMTGTIEDFIQRTFDNASAHPKERKLRLTVRPTGYTDITFGNINVSGGVSPTASIATHYPSGRISGYQDFTWDENWETNKNVTISYVDF